MKVNGAQCRLCGDVVISKFDHDFQVCKCNAIGVDGGNSYRRCVGDLDNFLPLPESFILKYRFRQKKIIVTKQGVQT